MSGLDYDTYESLRTPIVVLRVQGTSAPDLSARIIQFKYSDTHTLGGKHSKKKAGKHGANVDKAEIHISDPNHELTGDDRLKTDTRWDIRWGYPDDLSDGRWFLLKYYTPVYDATGFHSKKLMLYGTSINLTGVKGPRNWGRISSSEIAAQIAARHNLKANIDATHDRSATPYMQPLDMSDFEFLNELAADVDFEFFVENDVLYFRSRDTAYNENPRGRLVYGAPNSILLSFTPTVKATADIVAGVKSANTADGSVNAAKVDAQNVGGIHLGDDVVNSISDSARTLSSMKVTGSGKPITSSADLKKRVDQLKRDHDIDKIGKDLQQAKVNLETGKIKTEPVPDSTSVHKSTPETNQKKVETIGKAIKRDYLAATVEAQAECIGTPKLRARANFQIILPDPVLSGPWYAEETTHTIDDKGYKVGVKFHRGALTPETKKANDNNNRKSAKNGVADPNAGRTAVINLETGQVTNGYVPPPRSVK